jgi:hypothetical protein
MESFLLIFVICSSCSRVMASGEKQLMMMNDDVMLRVISTE